MKWQVWNDTLLLMDKSGFSSCQYVSNCKCKCKCTLYPSVKVGGGGLWCGAVLQELAPLFQ